MHPIRRSSHITKAISILLSSILLLLILFNIHMLHGQVRDMNKQAYAIPVEEITIDGMLDDWPEYLIRYSVDWEDPATFRIRFLNGPEDFNGYVMLGCNKQENLLYVAARVTDDHIVVRPDKQEIWTQDACNVYLSSSHQGIFHREGDRHLIYAMVPGESKWTAQQDGNPALNKLNTKNSGLNGAFSVVGDTISYEFSIPLYSNYPASRLTIKQGTRINFDMSFYDTDGDESGNAIRWTQWGGKSIRPDALGFLTFLENYDELGTRSGQVIDATTNEPVGDISFEVYLGGESFDQFRATETGEYKFMALPGEYLVKSSPGQWIDPIDYTLVIPEAGQEVKEAVAVKKYTIPQEFIRAAKIYKEIQGYKDSFVVDYIESFPGSSYHSYSTLSLSVEKQNKLRLIDPENIFVYSNYWADGTELIYHNPVWGQYQRADWYNWFLRYTDLNSHFFDLYILRILLSPDPQNALLSGVDKLESLGMDELYGRTMSVYRITRSGRSFMNVIRNPMNSQSHFEGRLPGGMKVEDNTMVTFWFDTMDGLIRKIRLSIPHEKGTIEYITTHKDIELNPQFKKSYFTFNPSSREAEVDLIMPPNVLAMESILLNTRAPRFQLTGLDGKGVALDDFRDKVVVLNFWTCLSNQSKEEIHTLNELHKAYSEDGVVILGISLDQKSRTVHSFLKKNNVEYPVLIGNKNIREDYGPINSLPTTIFIDKSSMVRHRIIGHPDPHSTQAEEVIKNLLK